MAVLGVELRARIESVLSLEAKAQSREIAENFANAVRPDLALHKADRFAGDLFNIMRGARRDFRAAVNKMAPPGQGAPIQGQAEQAFIDFLYDLLSPDSSMTRNDVVDFYKNHVDLLDLSIRRLNQSRSVAANILAVFRPFKQKYLDSWASSNVREAVDMGAFRSANETRIDAMRAAAKRLDQRVISNEVELDTWLNEVYDLFQKTAVYKHNDSTRDDSHTHTRVGNFRQLPSGMISEASERIYRQRWRTWRSEVQPDLLRFVLGFPAAAGALDSVGFAAQASQRVTNSNFPIQGEKSLDGLSTLPKIATPRITIRITSDLVPALEAERTWFDLNKAALEVAAWISTIQRIWAGHASNISSSVKIESPIGTSEVAIPQDSFDHLSQSMPQILSSLQ
jgi:hypothetical protein